MAQPLDIKRLAERLASAADRVAQSAHGLTTQATPTDLLIVAGGPQAAHTQANIESLPFAALFHDDRDRLGEALDRLETRQAA